ncbi:MAG: hypothetical protein HY347_04575, partial [candidate division NC10 bacterium]|nr:hypothetical protein [candidate division NC10 bacterium]
AIFFENVETATAPAQEVVITDQLDVAKMDLSTFSLGLIAFGDKQVTPPPGMSEFTTDVDLRPEKNLLVRITAHVDPPTGLLTWRFTSIDPDTGLPPEDPLVGFLPPNKNPPEGEGNVLFTVMPMPGLPTRTEIRNRARIVFDVNPPMDTPEWLNTLDHTKPESQVVPLAPIQPSSTFEVEWSGTDVGSGIKDYTIFVSEDGGPFTVWLGNITDTSATFTGQPGMPYAFYSVARDQTGNLEEVPPDPDTTTRVTNAPIANAGSDQTVDEGTTVTLDGTGSSDPDGDSLSFEWTQTAGPAVALGGATTATPSFRAPFVSSATTLTFQVTVSDGFASSTDTVVITVQDLGASIRGTVTGSGPIDGARLSAPEPKSHAGHRGGQSPRFHLDPETKGQPP